jgi:hypothetical protein
MVGALRARCHTGTLTHSAFTLEKATTIGIPAMIIRHDELEVAS